MLLAYIPTHSYYLSGFKEYDQDHSIWTRLLGFGLIIRMKKIVKSCYKQTIEDESKTHNL